MDIQSRLVEYINAKGIKQSAICSATGIEPTAFSKSMKLDRKLTIDEFGKVCKFLNVPMDSFVA